MKKYTLSILVFVAFLSTSCKSTKKSEAEKVDKASIKTEEPKKDTDFKSHDFVYFFKEFKKAVSSRDEVLLENLTDNQLNIQFDKIFNPTITKQILEVNSSKMIYFQLIESETVKVLITKNQIKIKDQMDSNIIFYFNKTEKGWKLFKTKSVIG